MADDAKADDHLDQLREHFAQQIRDTLRDLPAHQALQLADALCTIQINLLAGLRVTYRTRPVVDGDQVTEDWRQGLSVGEIMKKHGISRGTAYRYHPNASAKKRVAG